MGRAVSLLAHPTSETLASLPSQGQQRIGLRPGQIPVDARTTPTVVGNLLQLDAEEIQNWIGQPESTGLHLLPISYTGSSQFQPVSWLALLSADSKSDYLDTLQTFDSCGNLWLIPDRAPCGCYRPRPLAITSPLRAHHRFARLPHASQMLLCLAQACRSLRSFSFRSRMPPTPSLDNSH